MSVNTGIEWTDATCSPIRSRVLETSPQIAEAKGYTSLIQIAAKMAGHVGPHCERVSKGCDNCYSDSNNSRCLPANGTGLPFDRRSRDLVETFVDENILVQPLKWRTDKRIFWENQSDLFGEWVTDEQIDRVFAVIGLCDGGATKTFTGNKRRPNHTSQILTKRARRLRDYVVSRLTPGWVESQPPIRLNNRDGADPIWVVRGIRRAWLGVSVEEQATADERIALLLQTPAAIHFVSYEPAMGPVNFLRWLNDRCCAGIEEHFDGDGEYIGSSSCDCRGESIPRLDWVIAGAESGRGARPAHPRWFIEVQRQCEAAGVAFFFKQWGEYSPVSQTRPGNDYPKTSRLVTLSGLPRAGGGVAASDVWMHKLGKKRSGALLNGRAYKQFPEVLHA